MSMKNLRKAVQNAVRDEFELGTVIRWTMTYRDSETRYTYAALKCELGWVTTARTSGKSVAQVLTFDELLEHVSSERATNVAVSTSWTTIGEQQQEPLCSRRCTPASPDPSCPVHEADSPCLSRCRPSEGDVCGGPRCT